MTCNDWCSLLQRYRGAVRSYDNAMTSLTDVPGPHFNEAWHSAEVARTEVGVARAALLHHEHQHGCATDRRRKQEAAVQPTEEWVLGDQGQSGG